MRSYIGVHSWQLACEAAVLRDEDAPLFLREQLDQFPDSGKGYDVLLTALAWFDPDSALEYYDAAVHSTGQGGLIPRIWLEAYSESRLLQHSSEEQRVAYAAINALLWKNNPAAYKRERIYGLACARRSLEEFLMLPDWEHYIDYFLFAKLWLAFPEALYERVQIENVPLRFWCHNYNAIGQILLGKRRNVEDIPHLITLLEELCKQRRESPVIVSGGYAMVSDKALLHTLRVLDEDVQAELLRLLPELLVAVCKANGAVSVWPVAHLLTLIARLQCNTMMLLVPLRDKVEHGLDITRARRWIRNIRQAIPELTSEPEIALRMIRVFRLLVIARRIEQLTPEQNRRARRWLNHSQRFIDSVEFPFWQEQLQEERDKFLKEREAA